MCYIKHVFGNKISVKNKSQFNYRTDYVGNSLRNHCVHITYHTTICKYTYFIELI